VTSTAAKVSLRDVARAVAWCRLGSSQADRPTTDEAFHEAKRLGLLAQDPIWRATAKGEGLLIALGRLDPAPACERLALHVMWARVPGFERSQFVAAFDSSLVEYLPSQYELQLAVAKQWVLDEFPPATFFETVASIDVPSGPVVAGGDGAGES
jgi:hypothetical protein